MPMLADTVDAVVGVDTHRDVHEAEIARPTGSPIAVCSIRNDTGGFAELLAWIHDHAPGPRVVVAVEGTRSYGAALTRALTEAGLVVVECEQPTRSTRRGRGKSDAIDAHLAVLTALQLDIARLPLPRSDGDREALRILLTAREELSTTWRGQNNRLKALLLLGDDADRALGRTKLYNPALAELISREAPRAATREQAVRHAELRRLALALVEGRRALLENRAQILAIVDDLAPGLTSQPGIGPVSAAQAIVSFSRAGRCRNEAAFAALAGVSPLQASSGQTRRHRLNRSGDRELNRAVHTIAATRLRGHPETRAYLQRRLAEGRTYREVRRCLKRYIARQLYRHLTTAMSPVATIPVEHSARTELAA